MANIIQPIITRIDSSANWRTLNPVPKNGEQCIEDLGKGLFKLKIGDGVTPWIALAYWTSYDHNDEINQTILNITKKYPLKDDYYTLQTAIATVYPNDISLGQLIVFETREDNWDIYKFNGSKKSDYVDLSKWEKLNNKVEANPNLEDIANEPVVVMFDKKGLVTGYSKIIDGGTW